MRLPRAKYPSIDTASSVSHQFAPAVSIVLVVSILSCDLYDNTRGVVLDGSVPIVVEAQGGQAAFRRLCQAPLHIPLSAESPLLSQVLTVDFHSRHGLIATDPIEQRVFRFDSAGTALESHGGPGDGPEEFRGLQDALLLEDGSIIALDVKWGLKRIDPSGAISSLSGIEPLLAGGITLQPLGSKQVMVGMLRVTGPSVAIFDVETSTVRRSIVEQKPIPDGLSLLRGIELTSDPAGLVVALAAPYELSVDFYDPSGVRAAIWNAQIEEFLQAEPFRKRDRKVTEIMSWVRSGSRVLALGMPDRTHLLAAWDQYENLDSLYLRHFFLASYSLKQRAVSWIAEVPYRLVRARGDTLLMLNSLHEPKYEAVVCRGVRELAG